MKPTSQIILLILAILTSMASAHAAEPPAFYAQVSNFVALALREAPNDYAAYDRTGTLQSHAAAIAPTFATCGALPDPSSGFPIRMRCSSDWMPAATAIRLFEEAAKSLTASLPKDAIRNRSEGYGSWLVGNQKFELTAYAPPQRSDIQALILSSLSSRHLARSPLAASVKAMISRGLAALPEFDGLRDGDIKGKYSRIKEKFGAALPECRINEEIGTLECLTPSYADSPDAVFSAAKEAITAALPPGFSAANCSVPRYCDWQGPAEQIVGLMTGADHAVIIMISEKL